MKKIVPIIFLIAAFTNLQSQELNGLWISNDNLIHKGSNTPIPQDGVSIIDFDAKVLNAINKQYNHPVRLNRKQTKIKIQGVRGSLKLTSTSSDQIVLVGKKNLRYVFKKLEHTDEIDLNDTEITSFLVNQQCGLIQGMKGEFKKEPFFADKQLNNPSKRLQFIDWTNRANGYWYIKKIKDYVLFVFTTDQHNVENIFQIKSLDFKGIVISQKYTDNQITKLEVLKTCL